MEEILKRPAAGQVDAGTQDAQRGLGWDAVQGAGVRGVADGLGFVELADVDEGGGQREQRLDVAGIGGDPAAASGGVAISTAPESAAAFLLSALNGLLIEFLFMGANAIDPEGAVAMVGEWLFGPSGTSSSEGGTPSA